MTEVLPISSTRWCPETIGRLMNFYHPRGIYEDMEVEQVSPSIVQINNGRWSVAGNAIWETNFPQVDFATAADGTYFVTGYYRYLPVYIPPVYAYLPAQDVAEFYDTHQYHLAFKRVVVAGGVVVSMDDVGRIYADTGIAGIVTTPEDTKASSLVERRQHVENVLYTSGFEWMVTDLFENQEMIDTAQTTTEFKLTGNYVLGRNNQIFQSKNLYNSDIGLTTIETVIVTCEFDVDDPAAYSISISNNGGISWETAENDKEHTFLSAGLDLRLRILFHDEVRFTDYAILLKEAEL